MHIALVWYLCFQIYYFCISNRNHTLLYRNITTSGYIIIPVIDALNQVPQQYRNCWDVLKVLDYWLLLSRSPQKSKHLWKAMQFKVNNVFMPAVLLMRCFFDYIFKSCQSFPSIEVCIWSYFMEVCRPTNYNTQLPTCYSLWARRKKSLKSCSFLWALYDQSIKTINWINAFMFELLKKNMRVLLRSHTSFWLFILASVLWQCKFCERTCSKM